jgi:spore coat polysaccharide biosynthesis protein SpsF
MNFSKKPHVLIIIQARMESIRFPGKVLKEVLGKPLMAYLVERLRRVSNADALVIATTENPLDHQISEFCEKEKLPCFHGSEEDVLDRFYQCAKHYQADVIVRVTGDCPLIDPEVVEEVIQFFLKNSPRYDLVSNVEKRTYPRGMDVEVFTFKALEKAALEAVLLEEREHVTPYFYRHSNLFRRATITKDVNDSHFRWTVDTLDDFRLISVVLEHLYFQKPFFTLKDLLEIFYQHPEWVKINAHVKQKEIESRDE